MNWLNKKQVEKDILNIDQELDRRILTVQKSTKTNIKWLSPLHNKLRMKYPWYYHWCFNPISQVVHWSILALFVASIIGSGTYYYLCNNIQKSHASTTTCTWTDNSGAGDNNWGTTTNWSCGVVPTNAYDVVLDGSYNYALTIDTAATVGSFSVNSGYSQTITANANLATDTGQGGNGNFSLAGGTYTANATTLTILGNFSVSTGTFTKGTSTLIMKGAGSITTGGQQLNNFQISGSGGGNLPTYRSQNGSSANYGTSSITITKPTNAAAGDMLIAIIGGVDALGTVTPPSNTSPNNWTLIGSINDTTKNYYVKAYYKTVTSADASVSNYTFSSTSSNGFSGMIYDYYSTSGSTIALDAYSSLNDYSANASGNVTMTGFSPTASSTTLIHNWLGVFKQTGITGISSSWSNIPDTSKISAQSYGYNNSQGKARGLSFYANETTLSNNNQVSKTATLNNGGSGAGGFFITLTIQASTSTITTSGNVSVAGTLTTDANQTLSISNDNTVSMAAGATTTNNGTISGAGTLELVDTAGANLSTSGTLSSATKFTTATANVIIPQRTYGGAVSIYNNTASNYTATLGTATSQTLTFSSNFNANCNSTGTLTVQGDTYYPTVNIAGAISFTKASSGTPSITADDGTHTNTWTISGGADFSNGTLTAGLSTFIFKNTYNLSGNSQTFYKVQISAGSSDSTITATDSLLVSNTLTTDASQALSISSGKTVSMAAGSTTTNNGTISGAGTLELVDTAGANLSTGGTISSVTRFTTATANATVPARTYGGNVEFYNNTSSNYTATLGTATSQTLTFSGNFTPIANSTGNITIAADTYHPVINITGNYSNTNPSSGVPIINCGSSTWNITGNFTASAGTFNANTATITVSGNWDHSGATFSSSTSTVILNGTGTLNGMNSWQKNFYNLTVSANTKTTTLVSAIGVNGLLTIGPGTFDGNAAWNAVNIYNSTASTTPLSIDANATLSRNAIDFVISADTNIPASTKYVSLGCYNSSTSITPACNLLGNITASYGVTITRYSTGKTGTLNTNNHSLSTRYLYIGTNGQASAYGILNAGSSLITATGDVIIYSSDGISGHNTINMSTSNWSVGGNWTNNDTISCGTSTLTLNGSTAQTFTAGGTDSSKQPYNLTITNSSGVNAGVTFADSLTLASGGTFTDTTADTKLTFNAGSTYTFPTINLSGTSDHTILLRSSSSSAWNLNVDTNSTVHFVDVAYSNANHTINDFDGGVDSLHNVNWVFVNPNNSPTNDSLTLINPYSGTSNTIVADDTTNWQFQAKISDQDGITDINYVELRLANSADSSQSYDSLKFRWTRSDNSFMELSDSQNTATLTSTSANTSSNGNQWTIDFKIRLNANFAATNTIYAAELYTIDNQLASTDTNYSNFYQVAPLSLSLGVDNSSLTFGSLIPGDIFTLTTIATTSTNYPNGYTLSIQDNIPGTNSALLHTDGATRVPDYPSLISGPTQWSGTGLGFCVYQATGKDTSLWGTGNSESAILNKYAAVPQNATIIHTKISSPTSNDDTYIGYKLVVPNSQKTGSYSGNIIITALGVLQ